MNKNLIGYCIPVDAKAGSLLLIDMNSDEVVAVAEHVGDFGKGTPMDNLGNGRPKISKGFKLNQNQLSVLATLADGKRLSKVGLGELCDGRSAVQCSSNLRSLMKGKYITRRKGKDAYCNYKSWIYSITEKGRNTFLNSPA
jgi:DNA-binding MarR family transcriptional regulator